MNQKNEIMERFNKFCRLIGHGQTDLKVQFAKQLGVPRVISYNDVCPTTIEEEPSAILGMNDESLMQETTTDNAISNYTGTVSLKMPVTQEKIGNILLSSKHIGLCSDKPSFRLI